MLKIIFGIAVEFSIFLAMGLSIFSIIEALVSSPVLASIAVLALASAAYGLSLTLT